MTLDRIRLFGEIARDPGQLTEEQADGRACLFCGHETGAMAPVGIINGVQVFAHEVCPPRNVVLDAAPVLHPEDR